DPIPETRNPKPETRNPKPETRNPKPETRNPKPETPNPKPETRNPKPRGFPNSCTVRYPKPGNNAKVDGAGRTPKVDGAGRTPTFTLELATSQPAEQFHLGTYQNLSTEKGVRLHHCMPKIACTPLSSASDA
ncbi:hypothetical protein T484DRAFT_1608670, partial [Baffinella frigidus]